MTREPSAIRASTIGCATDSSRPARAAIRSAISMSSASEPGARPAGSSRPARSAKTASGALTRMSLNLGVLDERLQGSEAADRRLDRRDQGRHRRQLELGVFEDGGDRGPHQLLALGGAVERVEDLGGQARDEHPAHLAQGRRRQR